MLLYLKQQKKGESSSHTSAQVPNGDAVAVTTVKVSKDKIGSPRVPGPMDKVSRGTISNALIIISSRRPSVRSIFTWAQYNNLSLHLPPPSKMFYAPNSIDLATAENPDNFFKV